MNLGNSTRKVKTSPPPVGEGIKTNNMEQAKILIDELGTLMGKTDEQSEQRRREISLWFRDNSNPENDALFENFIHKGVGQVADALESIRLKIDA